MSSRLLARLDRAGDVVLTGPAVRALAAHGGPITYLTSSAGAPAARLLPGVDAVLVYDAPWVSFDPPPVDAGEIEALIRRVRERRIDEAVICVSLHQSPQPLALLLRLAGVERIAAVGVDYPGSLLDVRAPYEPALHEVEQSLAVAALAGYPLPAGDPGDLRLAVQSASLFEPGYVVVHPGASVPARALPSRAAADAVGHLLRGGWQVVLTGTAAERPLAESLAPAGETRVTVIAGDTTFDQYAAVVAGAAAIVCGNTVAAHVAAAVGTPVVEAFAPVVPAHRWRPWGVPHRLLGIVDIGCAGCRARTRPLPGQPCLEPFTGAAVAGAVRHLSGRRDIVEVA
jgi:ADP-heptose:LPS heptosyltransferase